MSVHRAPGPASLPDGIQRVVVRLHSIAAWCKKNGRALSFFCMLLVMIGAATYIPDGPRQVESFTEARR